MHEQKMRRFSSLNRTAIVSKGLVKGRLAVEVRESTAYPEHPAGTLVCDPLPRPDVDYDTIGQLGRVFLDWGAWAPRGE